MNVKAFGMLAATALLASISSCRYDAEAGRDALTRTPGPPRVLLIGIDGVRPDVLSEVETPHIDDLVERGFIVMDATTTTPTVSGPSWSSMVTGVWPEKHGVRDNGFEGRRYDEFPDFLSRLEAARPELRTVAALDWTPLADQPDDVEAIGAGIDVRFVVDGYEVGWAEGDSAVAMAVVHELESENPHAIFAYLGNPDETSHQHASIGPEYREAIRIADRHIGWMIEALRDREDAPDWLILGSTDHGRRPDGGHGGLTPEELTIFAWASGDAAGRRPPDRDVHIVDLAATALDHMGADSSMTATLDGRSLLRR